jgi:hypothetical protein
LGQREINRKGALTEMYSQSGNDQDEMVLIKWPRIERERNKTFEAK